MKTAPIKIEVSALEICRRIAKKEGRTIVGTISMLIREALEARKASGSHA